jgi:hypothetical protein
MNYLFFLLLDYIILAYGITLICLNFIEQQMIFIHKFAKNIFKPE